MPLDSVRRAFGVLVVGAGPAGIAAAVAAAEAGARVGVVDDNPGLGGQIWRGEDDHAHPGPARAWFRRLRAAGVTLVPGARVFAAPGPGVVLAETEAGAVTLAYDRLILAPGARELFLPFPGWTLPGVTGAGGLQALAKGGVPVAGRRVVVAGSGPLLLAVAAHLRAQGATIVAVAEQAPQWRVAQFGLRLLSSPAKLGQAAILRLGALRGVPYSVGWWPARAEGVGRVESVRLTDGRATRDLPCDALACGFGLVPNAELPRLLGCEVVGGAVSVDEWQGTTLGNVYAAGEATGVGGVELALVVGTIAGLAAAGRPDEARRHFPARRRARAFAAALSRAFAPRDELRHLAEPGTVVCRCEDVTLGQVAPYPSARAAKLQTRCGMGPCQGRICGPALRFLLGWGDDSVRPPLGPVRLGSLVTPPEP